MSEKSGINRYKIIEKLGEGGMGQVYLAEDLNLKRLVAVKKAVESVDLEILRMAEKEARTLANLKHPNLPTVFDYFIENNVQYIVMEYVTGSNLCDLMKQRPDFFTISRNLGIMDSLINVLLFLHGQYPVIVHRDIKPKNIIIAEDGNLYLLDFGLVKNPEFNQPAGTHVTLSSRLFGFSPNYSPLEQRKGEPTFIRADIYSLSATLYFIYGRRAPADSLDRAEMLSKGCPDPLIPITALNPGIDPRTAEIIMKGLSLHQESRPRTIAELLGVFGEEETQIAGFNSYSQSALPDFGAADHKYFPDNFGKSGQNHQTGPPVGTPIVGGPLRRSSRLLPVAFLLLSAAGLLGFFGYENWCYSQNKVIAEHLEKLPVDDFDSIEREWKNYEESLARTSYFKWGIKEVQDKLQQKVLDYAGNVIEDYRKGGKSVKKDESYWQRPQVLLEKLAVSLPGNNTIKSKIAYLKGQKDFAFAFEKGAAKQSLLESAQRNYQSAIQLDPKFGDPYFMLALTHIYGKARDYSRALENIELATKNDFPFDTRAKAVKGDCLQALADATVKKEQARLKTISEVTSEEEARSFVSELQDSLKNVRDRYVAAKNLYEEAKGYGTVDKSLREINNRLKKLDEGISATDKLNLLLDVINLTQNQDQ